MIDLMAIKARHDAIQIGDKLLPKINALGSKDMQDIRDLIDEVERISAENKTFRIAMQTIAKRYMQNWKPGDTHQSTQRLSAIAHDALAVVDGQEQSE